MVISAKDVKIRSRNLKRAHQYTGSVKAELDDLREFCPFNRNPTHDKPSCDVVIHLAQIDQSHCYQYVFQKKCEYLDSDESDDYHETTILIKVENMNSQEREELSRFTEENNKSVTVFGNVASGSPSGTSGKKLSQWKKEARKKMRRIQAKAQEYEECQKIIKEWLSNEKVDLKTQLEELVHDILEKYRDISELWDTHTSGLERFGGSISHLRHIISIMKPIDVAVIRYYTENGGVYIPLNRILRTKNTFGQKTSIVEDYTPFEKYAETLVDALKKWMVHYPYKGTVYRKLSLPRKRNPYKPDLVGTTVEHHDFLSTLESGGMFYPPGNAGDQIILIEIRNAKGVNIQMLSNTQGEKEILLLPNSKFKVISVDENYTRGPNSQINADIYVVLEMTETIDVKLPSALVELTRTADTQIFRGYESEQHYKAESGFVIKRQVRSCNAKTPNSAFVLTARNAKWKSNDSLGTDMNWTKIKRSNFQNESDNNPSYPTSKMRRLAANDRKPPDPRLSGPQQQEQRLRRREIRL